MKVISRERQEEGQYVPFMVELDGLKYVRINQFNNGGEYYVMLKTGDKIVYDGVEMEVTEGTTIERNEFLTYLNISAFRKIAKGDPHDTLGFHSFLESVNGKKVVTITDEMAGVREMTAQEEKRTDADGNYLMF